MSSTVVTIDRRDISGFHKLGSGGQSTVYEVSYTCRATLMKEHYGLVPFHQDIDEQQVRGQKLAWELNLEYLCGFNQLNDHNTIQAAAKKLNTVETKELELLSRLKHPYIVKLYGVVDEIPDFYLVLELCEGGSLRSHLNNHQHASLHPRLAYTWIEQGALAIEYLHKEGVIHRDLKADNFLISSTRNLKLCDFGISKNADRTVTTRMHGTVGYTAPENFIEYHLSPLSDIFSFATVIWEILTRQIPFKGCEYANYMHRVGIEKQRPPIPADCPPKVAGMLKECWDEDRKKRPRIESVVGVVSTVRKKIQSECSQNEEKVEDSLPYTCAEIKVFNDACVKDVIVSRERFAINREGPFELHKLLKRTPDQREDDAKEGQPQSMLKIPHGTTVGQIKNRISSAKCDGLHLFNTSSEETEMKDDQTLIDYKMCCERTTLYLTIDVEVIVNSLSGKLTTRVCHLDDISTIKNKIHKELGFEPMTQQLLHEGRTLHNDDVVSELLNEKLEDVTLELICHDEITLSVNVQTSVSQGTDSEPPSVSKVAVYPSHTILEMVNILQEKLQIPFIQDEAVLYKSQVLFSSTGATSIFKTIEKCMSQHRLIRKDKSRNSNLQQLILEANVTQGSQLLIEVPVEVRVRTYNETGKHYNDISELTNSEVTDYYTDYGQLLRQRQLLKQSQLQRGTAIDILVYPSQTISDMKNRMKRWNIIPAAGLHAGTQFRLLHGETKLEDDQLVSHYNICDGSKIVLEKQLRVHVSTKGDEEKTVIVAAWESDTMAQLMHTAGIQPKEEYLMQSKSSLIQPSGSSARRPHMQLTHSSKDIANTDPCCLLPSDDDEDTTSKTLFLLDRRFIMRIHLNFGGDFASIFVDEDEPKFTATVTPSFTVQELKDSVDTQLKLMGLSCKSMKIAIKEQLLHDDNTLSSYKITDDSHLTIRGRVTYFEID